MNKPICPKCDSVNTVRKVKFCSTTGNNYTKRGYFCINCLIEFDTKFVRVYTAQGNWVENIPIEKYV